MLREAIAQRAFPAASVAVTHASQLVALKSFGHFTYEEDSAGAPSLSLRSLQRQGGDFDSGAGAPLLAGVARSGDFDSDVAPATLFDLASLTKVVATTTMAMILYERGLLELDAPVVGTIPEFRVPSDPRRSDVTLRMLLAHSSGLPAYEKLFLRARTRDELLHAAFTTPLSADPGSRAEYSDIGFIILGAALDRIAEESLDRFCQREVFGPLSMSHTTFNPPAEMRDQIPPTADERTFRNRIIQGEVQDENAFVLGGVAAHAGLFSTAEDLARFAHAMLQCGAGTPAREMPAAYHPLLRPETIALFTRRQAAPAGTSRALGWDTPSSPSQSGKYFGPSSFGHLGYTGASLWIDPARQLSVTLLTNRTWPDCANEAIKQVRPKFHDAVIEALNEIV
ncbi:Beta-lactamase [Candidatus Sulfotelmatobacter kueseliae]|uniref:Beta-lactamase n=1 Tax=Candidatus Sulfotelmatobacter kueseliae TaxID=2042962 RepID=A0A2U3L2B4_9BACT|nr:Beta-lactamase [Candidatus Sulfotelmatobacter kueseliae]